jgi:hypothetical protein
LRFPSPATPTSGRPRRQFDDQSEWWFGEAAVER